MTCLKLSAGKQQRWEERQAQKTLGSLSNALHIDHTLKQHHHSFGSASTTCRQELSYSGSEYAAILHAAQGHLDLAKIDSKFTVKQTTLFPALQS